MCTFPGPVYETYMLKTLNEATHWPDQTRSKQNGVDCTQITLISMQHTIKFYVAITSGTWNLWKFGFGS